MADDREILRAIWDGKVPVCFSLASEEVFTVERPETLYLLVPRQSYFPLVTDQVQRHFLRHVDPDNHCEMWLEDSGQPIRWHYPIGVLLDLSGAASQLPWTLIVHFRNFPEDEMLHCPSKDAVESNFMSMVKEADCLKHRSHVMNAMQKRDHQQLWVGLRTDKFDQFWGINAKLMDHSSELFRLIPFRIYFGDRPFIQQIFVPTTENGRMRTLRDLLQQATPSILDTSDGKPSHRVLIQGIEPTFDTEVHWLSEHMSHPDNFLHISIVPL